MIHNSAFSHFCDRMIQSHLPGGSAHKKMVPLPDNRPAVTDVMDDLESLHGAVLVLCSIKEPAALLYTLRTSSLSNHGGQISFPGGRQETGESLFDTAQRETVEEVGISSDQYKICGYLSPLFVPVSGYIIHPCLAFCHAPPDIKIQPEEVNEAFWVSLDDLLDDHKVKIREQILRNHRYKIPFWDIHSEPLWGATAMITSEVVALYRSFLDENDSF